jgi:hypothetical protein
LSNPGTKILAALGFTGSLGNGVGWIFDTAWSGAPNFLGIDPTVKVVSLFGGFGKKGHMRLMLRLLLWHWEQHWAH